jgi:exosome complex RNA-binding protein Rrp4
LTKSIEKIVSTSISLNKFIMKILHNYSRILIPYMLVFLFIDLVKLKIVSVFKKKRITFFLGREKYPVLTGGSLLYCWLISDIRAINDCASMYIYYKIYCMVNLLIFIWHNKYYIFFINSIKLKID